MNNNKLDRYQYQPWYIKLWRRRWYLWAYSVALKQTAMWIYRGLPCNEWGVEKDSKWIPCSKDSRYFTFKFTWMLAKSEAQIKMNWLYDIEEIEYETESY